jgi:uncharacterized protein DUF4394
MSPSLFIGRAIPAALLTFLAGMVTAQPLPHTSLNKSAAGHAYSIGPAPARVAHPAGSCVADGLCLAVTLALDNGNPSQCGTATDLAVSIGDSVNICYTITNNSATTLNYHTLGDDHVGNVFTNNNIVLAPGANYQYNRTITASTNPNSDTGTFTSTWTATDVLPGYTSDDAATFNFVDISASGTPLNLSDDGAAAITMPFAFSFYGASSSNLCIGNNGGILFDVASCSSFPYNNQALPTASLPNPAILPYWDDMLANGTIYYGAVGSAPNRQFVIEYQSKFAYGDGGDPTGQTGATFEAILNEADGSIDFEYQTATFGGAAANYDDGVSATVGLQSTATFANQYSYNTASLSDGLAIHWTPVQAVTYSATVAATIEVGSPNMITTPNVATGFSPTVTTGSSTTSALLIDNIGNRDLDWSLTPPAPNAHFPKTPRVVRPVGASHVYTSPFGPLALRPGQAKVSQPFGTVPIYSAQAGPGFDNYVSFDASTPGTFDTIAPGITALWGLTFVDGDFSKQYAMEYATGNFDTISTLDGTITVIGNTGLTTCCLVTPTGLRWDPTSGTTYLVITDFRVPVSTLYTIDLATAATTLVGAMSGLIFDITIDSSGLMYGIDVDSDALVAIDKTSGATQPIGSIGFDAVFGEGLDFDPETGILYLASADENTARFYTVDPTTGTATLVGALAGELDTIAVAKSGATCSTPADTPWLTYDVTSGTVTPDPDQTHPATVNVGFDATGLAPGAYSANLCIYSNDVAHSRVPIPVHLTVTDTGPADTIFQDGFDGAGTGGTAVLAQTSSTKPIQGNSVACNDGSGTTSDNQYWRRYDFSEYGVAPSASVSSVDVSVEQTAGAPNVTVTLYTIPHGVAADTIDLAQLSQIGTATAPAPADAALTSFNLPVTGTVADTSASDLVVEVSTLDGSGDGTGFFIGSTTSAETHPGFLSSATCGVTDPTPVGDLGFPDMHIIEAVNVSY